MGHCIIIMCLIDVQNGERSSVMVERLLSNPKILGSIPCDGAGMGTVFLPLRVNFYADLFVHVTHTNLCVR